MDGYYILGKVGQGIHGVVMKAKDKRTGTTVALKKILIKGLDEGIPINAIREIRTLQVLNNRYVVKLYDAFPQGMSCVLVFEYLGLNLSNIIYSSDIALDESKIKRYVDMLFRGLSYIHKRSIMHRDLKPDNLLISSKGVLKIADLGLSRIFYNYESRPYSHEVATRWYRAPEVLYGSKTYTEAIDLWSAGCILGELLNRSPLFPGENDIDQLAIVIKALGTFNEDTWPEAKELPDYSKITFPPTRPIPLEDIIPDASEEAKDLVKKFLVYDGRKRITAGDALYHAFFNCHPLPALLNEMPKPLKAEGNGPAKVGGGNKNIKKGFENLKDLKKSIFIST